jgi:hypothetical protein
MGSKRDEQQDSIAGKSLTGKAGIPGDEDVEGHKWKAKNAVPTPEPDEYKAVPDDEDVEGHKWKAKNAVPDDEDVEGHIFDSKRTSGELTNRKLPNDSPHGESYIGRNKG